MPTQRFFVCPKCQAKQWAHGLFDALKDHASGTRRRCPQCQADTELQLTLPFELGAGPFRGRVLDAFLPDPITPWPNKDGNLVAFHPFLVVLESLDNKDKMAWLPYWHLVTDPEGKVKKKYGQWAPCADLDSYSSLVEKARLRGYLK